MVVAILMTSSRAKCCGGVIVCRGVEEIGDRNLEIDRQILIRNTVQSPLNLI